jgi:hypothetical protein
VNDEHKRTTFFARYQSEGGDPGTILYNEYEKHLLNMKFNQSIMEECRIKSDDSDCNEFHFKRENYEVKVTLGDKPIFKYNPNNEKCKSCLELYDDNKFNRWGMANITDRISVRECSY